MNDCEKVLAAVSKGDDERYTRIIQQMIDDKARCIELSTAPTTTLQQKFEKNGFEVDGGDIVDPGRWTVCAKLNK